MTGPKTNQRRYMTIEQLSEYIGLSEHSIRHRVARNEIPHRRLGRRLLFDRVLIDHWFTGLPGTGKAGALRQAS